MERFVETFINGVAVRQRILDEGAEYYIVDKGLPYLAVEAIPKVGGARIVNGSDVGWVDVTRECQAVDLSAAYNDGVIISHRGAFVTANKNYRLSIVDIVEYGILRNKIHQLARVNCHLTIPDISDLSGKAFIVEQNVGEHR